MANHMRGNEAGRDNDAKRASLLASAQAAQRSQRGAGSQAPSEAGQYSTRQTRTVREASPRSVSTRHPERSEESPRSADLGKRNVEDPSASARGDKTAHSRTRSRGDGPRHGRAQQQPRQPGRESLGAFIRRNSVYIISVVAVIAMAVLMLMLVRGCIPEAQDGSGERSGTATGNAGETAAYDWSYLDRTDGRLRYIVDGQVRSRLGIDVSENQYSIDWQAVANDGIEFAIIRLGYRGATEGDLYLDERFEENLAGAKAAGIDCGVYFFSQAQTLEESVAEADFVVEHLNGAELECPIAFDSEEAVLNVEKSRTSGLSDTAMTVIAEAFCERVAQSGYRAIVYGNSKDLSRYYYDSMDSRDFWWAEYGVEHPSTDLAIDMWQYSSAGTVAGIETEVDMNIDLSSITGS